MSQASTDTIAKWVGLMAGLAVAFALLIAWQAPATGDILGADVKLVATPPGELTLKPAGAFLEGRRLTAAGAVATGRLELRNITGRALEVRVRLLPSAPDLDRALRVELDDGGRSVTSGRLGDLRRWGRGRVTIEPGGTRRLDASALVVRGARDYEGRVVDATLELRAHPVDR